MSAWLIELDVIIAEGTSRMHARNGGGSIRDWLTPAEISRVDELRARRRAEKPTRAEFRARSAIARIGRAFRRSRPAKTNATTHAPPMHALTGPARYGLVPVDFVGGLTVERPDRTVILTGEEVIGPDGELQIFVALDSDRKPVLVNPYRDRSKALSEAVDDKRQRHESHPGHTLRIMPTVSCA